MATLHDALGRMRDLSRWFVWRLTWDAKAQKYQKHPCPLDGRGIRIDGGQQTNSYAAVVSAVEHLNAQPQCQSHHLQYALGFWLTADCGYWFFDLDKAVGNDYAMKLVQAFPGALVEQSSGGKGIHVIGKASAIPLHRCKPPKELRGKLSDGLELEFYHEGRGIAFGLNGEAEGSADTYHDAMVTALCARLFPSSDEGEGEEGDWGKPRADWRGPDDDGELIRRALNARQSAASAFGGKASFAQLWEGKVAKENGADMALAHYLAYWTGCYAPRMERLMRMSGLVRPKWDERRRDATYIQKTINKACAQCSGVYSEGVRGAEERAPVDGAVNPCTELENAHRLRKHYGDQLIYVNGLGWHEWRPPWVRDDNAAERRAQTLGRIVQEEVPALEAWVESVFEEGKDGTEEHEMRKKTLDARRKWGRFSESRTVVRNSLELLRPHLTVNADVMDKSPLLVGCPSGVIDLKTIAMREHRRDDFITKSISVDYDPSARAPRWEAFLHEIMGGDAGLIDYIQTLCGYILSAHRTEQILPILYGTGANGKSTFLRTMQALLGDYAGSAPPGLLISSGENAHPTGLASLQGRRLVVISETGEGGRLHEEQVKVLTGGDVISARLMRQDFFEFEPTHVCILQSNHKPRVKGTDEGIWRRLKLIPFTVTISPEKRDRNLPKALLDELPGILAWTVEGWRKYDLRGFSEPARVRAATAEYRSDSDQVGAFLSERCVIASERTVSSKQLFESYQRWCEENGERFVSHRAFTQRLSERFGVKPTHTNTGSMWRGLALDHAAPLREVPVPSFGVT